MMTWLTYDNRTHQPLGDFSEISRGGGGGGMGILSLGTEMR